jgi:hypothetical protein
VRLDKVKADNLDKTTIGNIRSHVLDIQEHFLKGILWPMVQPRNFTIDQWSPLRILGYNFGGTEDLESIEEDVREDDIRIQKKYLLRWLDERFRLKQQVAE